MLGNGGSVDQRAWKQYQAYLSRIQPVTRADFYRRLMDRQGIKSIRALARVTGEDWSRVARILKVLELPSPILEYLRTHDSPALASTFTEMRLRELARVRDSRRTWGRFQTLLAQIGHNGDSLKNQ